MRRAAQQSLDYDIAQSPHRPVESKYAHSKRSHLYAPDPRPKMTLIGGLCCIVASFVYDKETMQQFCRLNKMIIDGLTGPEKERLRQALREAMG